MKVTSEAMSLEQIQEVFEAMPTPQLLGQELAMMGAHHALSMLLRDGCTAALAEKMKRDIETAAPLLAAVMAARGERQALQRDEQPPPSGLH